jgi:hypothetical protein
MLLKSILIFIITIICFQIIPIKVRATEDLSFAPCLLYGGVLCAVHRHTINEAGKYCHRGNNEDGSLEFNQLNCVKNPVILDDKGSFNKLGKDMDTLSKGVWIMQAMAQKRPVLYKHHKQFSKLLELINYYPTSEPSKEFLKNSTDQLKELVRIEFNIKTMSFGLKKTSQLNLCDNSQNPLDSDHCIEYYKKKLSALNHLKSTILAQAPYLGGILPKAILDYEKITSPEKRLKDQSLDNFFDKFFYKNNGSHFNDLKISLGKARKISQDKIKKFDRFICTFQKNLNNDGKLDDRCKKVAKALGLLSSEEISNIVNGDSDDDKLLLSELLRTTYQAINDDNNSARCLIQAQFLKYEANDLYKETNTKIALTIVSAGASSYLSPVGSFVFNEAVSWGMTAYDFNEQKKKCEKVTGEKLVTCNKNLENMKFKAAYQAGFTIAGASSVKALPDFYKSPPPTFSDFAEEVIQLGLDNYSSKTIEKINQ